jgi:hypothetical protein
MLTNGNANELRDVAFLTAGSVDCAKGAMPLKAFLKYTQEGHVFSFREKFFGE